MPKYTVEALRTIRSLQAAYAKGGRSAQAEQMRTIGDQVEAMIEERAAIKATLEQILKYQDWGNRVEKLAREALADYHSGKDPGITLEELSAKMAAKHAKAKG